MIAFFNLLSLAATSTLFSSLEDPRTLAKHLARTRIVDVRETVFSMTPLMWAAQNGLEESVSLLLRHGACVHLYDIDGYSALTHAVMNGYISIVKKLVNAGSSVSHVTWDKGNNALMWAVAYSHADIAMYLLDYCDIICLNTQGSGGGTALHLAASKSNMADVVKAFINRGADYRLFDLDANQPSSVAAYTQNSAVVTAILESRVLSQPGYTHDIISARTIAHDNGFTQIVAIIDTWLDVYKLTLTLIP